MRSEEIQTHRDLIVWQKAIDFVETVYALSGTFPEEEKFGLTSQIRRASVSISSNIAEGAARQSTKEFIRFLYMALGSLSEVETQIIIALRLRFINDISKIAKELETIRKMILNLIKSLKEKL